MAVRRKLYRVEDTMARLDLGVNEIDYVTKKAPILTLCPRGVKQGQFETALGVALDEKKKHIYICDHRNKRVQVLTIKGEFVAEIGVGVLVRPWGIVVTADHVFVTDVWHCFLIKFCKQKHEMVNKVGGFGKDEGRIIWPGGFAIDTNGDVYIADTLNNRITVYTEELKFKICLGKDKLKLPKDIKLTTEEVIVLDHSSNCIHFMSREGQVRKSIISQGEGKECAIFNADFFCVDHSGNLIISNRKHDNIKIFTKDGEIIHTFGSHGLLKGEFIKPKGICISWKGTIYVVSENPEQVLQTF